jgi:hypothetical protein
LTAIAPLVVVDDLDIRGAIGGPDEAQTPLTIDAQTVLTDAIAPQDFQTIAGRHTQVGQTEKGGRINYPAVLFLVWSLIVGSLDNVLKPLVLGRGVQVPMAVIFVGAIGGFISSGIIGLFVGAVVLTLGYKLLLAWVYERAEV